VVPMAARLGLRDQAGSELAAVVATMSSRSPARRRRMGTEPDNLSAFLGGRALSHRTPGNHRFGGRRNLITKRPWAVDTAGPNAGDAPVRLMEARRASNLY
jgi:hypothetical protein